MRRQLDESGRCWSRVEVEALLLQEFLKPFFILAPRELLKRKKERSFMEDGGVHVTENNHGAVF